MQTQLTQNQIRDIILAELPEFFRKDIQVREYILEITRREYADKTKTEDRIDRILDELRNDREKQDKKWAAQEKKWEAQEKKWEAWERRWQEKQKEDREKWEDQKEKWAAQEKKWEAWEKRWEERQKEDKEKWLAQEKKWEENQKVINQMLAEIKGLGKKYDSTIGALGSRWGIQTEKAFRDALRSILEDSFGVKVEQYLDWDEEGTVFYEPDQVELDVIIYNGTLILCEIKSDMNKSDMYVFWRKKKFYEDRHARKADRVIVISPMVDRRAVPTAQKLGIEIFGYADEVNL
ncbi:MAG: PD-(D/E)XK nuclease family protein [Desulfococcaceae bacterium]